MGTKTALIIEDEYIIAQSIEMILQDMGFTVVGIAPDVRTAIRMGYTHRPHLITSDGHLQEGLGPHAVAEIRLYAEHDEWGHKPDVVYISGDPSFIAMQDPNTPCLGKPFTTRQLKHTIQQMIGGS